MRTALTFVLVALVATAVGLGVVYAADPFDPDAYAAKLTITATNSGTTTIAGPIAATVYASNIAASGLLSDAGVAFTDATNAPTGGLALDLDEDEATWWAYMNIPAGETALVNAYMSGPETTTLFPVGDDSSIEVDDADSLDITDDLVIEAIVAAASVPEDGDAWVVHKRGAYMLGLDAEGLFAFVDHGASSYTDMAIDGPGDTTGIGSRSGCSSNWECLSDGSNSTYVHPSTIASYQTDTYSLADAGLPGFVDIIRVDVHTRRKSQGSAVSHGLRLNGSDSKKSMSSTNSVPITYTDTITRPGGGAWTLADLEDLQVYLSARNQSGSSTRVYDVFVRVHHTAIPEMVRSSPIAHGAVHDVRLEFDDPDLSLYVDDNLVDTTGSAGSISTNSNTLAIGSGKEGSAFRGGIGGVRIGDTSATTTAYKLDLQMAPAHITPGTDGSSANDWEWTGTIADQSGNGNDATYSITYDPTDVDVTVSGVEIPPPALVTGRVDDDVPDVLGDPDPSVFTRKQPTEEAREKRGWGLFIQPVIDTAERSGMPAEAWFFSLLTVAAAVAAGRVWKHAPSYWIATGVAATVYALGAFIFGLPLWYLVVIGISGVATVGIVDYLWSGRTHTA